MAIMTIKFESMEAQLKYMRDHGFRLVDYYPERGYQSKKGCSIVPCGNGECDVLEYLNKNYRMRYRYIREGK